MVGLEKALILHKIAGAIVEIRYPGREASRVAGCNAQSRGTTARVHAGLKPRRPLSYTTAGVG